MNSTTACVLACALVIGIGASAEEPKPDPKPQPPAPKEELREDNPEPEKKTTPVVLAISDDGTSMTISMGTVHAVHEGYAMTIYRHGEPICRIWITEVHHDTSTAKIIQRTNARAIRVNDDVDDNPGEYVNTHNSNGPVIERRPFDEGIGGGRWNESNSRYKY